MSTDYYNLNSPITNLKLFVEGQHYKLTVFCNHQNCGTLFLTQLEVSQIIKMFVGERVVRSYYGGDKCGKTVEIIGNVEYDECLISEYGEITNLGEIRR